MRVPSFRLSDLGSWVEKNRDSSSSITELILDLPNGTTSISDEAFAELNNLTVLTISGSDLSCLPVSLTNLCKLEKLTLMNCSSLLELPANLSELVSLRELYIWDCGINCLPPDIVELHCLQSLEIENCCLLRELPPNMDRLVMLMKISIRACGVKCLPESIMELPNIQVLDLQDCYIQSHRYTVVRPSDHFKDRDVWPQDFTVPHHPTQQQLGGERDFLPMGNEGVSGFIVTNLKLSSNADRGYPGTVNSTQVLQTEPNHLFSAENQQGKAPFHPELTGAATETASSSYVQRVQCDSHDSFRLTGEKTENSQEALHRISEHQGVSGCFASKSELKLSSNADDGYPGSINWSDFMETEPNLLSPVENQQGKAPSHLDLTEAPAETAGSSYEQRNQCDAVENNSFHQSPAQEDRLGGVIASGDEEGSHHLDDGNQTFQETHTKFKVTEEQIRKLMDSGLTKKDAARTLKRSVSTLKRYKNDLNLGEWPSSRGRTCRSATKRKSNTESSSGSKNSHPNLSTVPNPACRTKHLDGSRHHIFPGSGPLQHLEKNLSSTSKMTSRTAAELSDYTSSKGVAESLIVYIVKAAYGEKLIRFNLSSTSTIAQLKKKVAEMLQLDASKILIEYVDDENDWVLMCRAADLQLCLQQSSLSGSNRVKLKISE